MCHITKSVIQKVCSLAFQCSENCGCNYLLHLSKVNFDKEKILSLLEYDSPPLETPVLTDLASFPYKGIVRRQHTGFPEQQVQVKTWLHLHDKLLIVGKGSFSGASKFLV